MAQTIATVRGTITANNASQVTLFTQSGGNSTRVILNQVTWYYPGNPSSNYRGHLLHVSSSGPITVIGYHYISSGGWSSQMMPNPNATSPTQIIGIGTSYGLAHGMAAYNSSGTATWVGSDAQNWTLASGNSYIPQNCWIGPGDSIAFSQYNTPYGYSATVGYHFTTITES
jgi:hypothetical protein